MSVCTNHNHNFSYPCLFSPSFILFSWAHGLFLNFDHSPYVRVGKPYFCCKNNSEENIWAETCEFAFPVPQPLLFSMMPLWYVFSTIRLNAQEMMEGCLLCLLMLRRGGLGHAVLRNPELMRYRRHAGGWGSVLSCAMISTKLSLVMWM